VPSALDAGRTDLGCALTPLCSRLRGKRNYEGRWWCSTSDGHVEFESLLEREALMMADFDVDVVAVAAQPLALLRPRQIEGSTYHVPDFFVRLSNGDGRIVDVKRLAAIGCSEDQFVLTRAARKEIGWQYEVFTGMQPIFGKNVRWLSGYRQDRYAPATALRRRSSMRSRHPRRSVSASNGRLGNAAHGSRTFSRTRYHLMWKQALSADLTVPLSMQTVGLQGRFLPLHPESLAAARMTGAPPASPISTSGPAALCCIPTSHWCSSRC
jgi:hypothetical protein